MKKLFANILTGAFLAFAGVGILASSIQPAWFGGENSGSGDKSPALSDLWIGTRAVAQGFNIPNNSSVLGHLLAGLAPGGSAPTASAGTVTAGSTDWVGQVTAAAPAAITITFGAAFTVAPICFVNNQTTTSTTRPQWATTTTTLVITGGFTTSDKVNWSCIGSQR